MLVIELDICEKYALLFRTAADRPPKARQLRPWAPTGGAPWEKEIVNHVVAVVVTSPPFDRYVVTLPWKGWQRTHRAQPGVDTDRCCTRHCCVTRLVSR